MSPADKKCVMIIAGEASGDLHGAKVVTALRRKCPDISFSGIGGNAMESAGVHILVDAHQLSVVGITEIFAKGIPLLKGISAAKNHLRRLRPDLLILIDFPDFNLHVAATAKKVGVPVLYYISPQIWAWRAGRAKKIKRRVDHMAVILPFEKDFYHRYGVPVTFVGHPLLDTYSPQNTQPVPDHIPPLLDTTSGATTRTEDSTEPLKPVVGLLPGSRDKEVERLLPEMLRAAAILKQKIPGVEFLLSLASSVKRELIEEILSIHGEGLDCHIETGGVHKVFSKSSLLVAASGTVTMEAAMAGIPMVIIYKVSPISYWLGRALIQVDYIGLANLIAGREIVPELIQHEVTPEKIAGTVLHLLDDPKKLARCKDALLKLRHELGGPGASDRVADIAVRMLDIDMTPKEGS